MSQREPIFNVHPAIVGTLALLAAVHLALALLPEPDWEWWTLALAFIPARYSGLASDIPGGDVSAAASFVTHMLVHGDVTHLAFNSVWLLAFGGAIARRLGGVRCLALAVACGIAGAVAFMFAHLGELVPVVGASGAISGLMGGVFRFLFNVSGPVGVWQLGNAPRSIPTMPLARALTDRRVLIAITIWVAANFLALAGVGGPSAGIEPGSSAGIAWEAHLGGFFAGCLLFSLFEAPQDEDAPGETGPDR